MAHDLEKKWRSKDVIILENVDFSTMLLCERVLSGLAKAGFKKPSPIQLEAIPTGRFGKDLLVQAKSGTGKTLVFVIVALEMLHRKLFRPQVLILVPTREIATQICSVVKTVGSCFPKLRCDCFIGGLPVADDIQKALNCQIAVGTPGRIKQLIQLKALSTNSIRLVVFDEADELLAFSWQDDIDGIFNSLPEDKQVIATSATYPPKLRKVMFKYLRDPYVARLDSMKLALLGIIHYAKIVESSAMPIKQYDLRLAALEPILTTLKFTQCLVYCNGIHKVETLYRDIKKWGFSVTYISSNRDQKERLKAIDCLKRFKCKVLVSSDVTARGIDAENVDLVVNFDISNCIETYLHRSGRAGRYGTVGITITLVDKFELKYLAKIEQEAHFKSYELPDPLPSDLIQNPSLEKYAIEIEIPEEDGALEEEEKCDNKKTNGFFYNWKNGVKEDNIDQNNTDSKCQQIITSDRRNADTEEPNGFSESASLEISSLANDIREKKHVSLTEKSHENSHKSCEFSVNGTLKNSSSCEYITESAKSFDVKPDSVSEFEVLNKDGLVLNCMASCSEVSSDISCCDDKNSVEFNECKKSEVIRDSPPENVSVINSNETPCDINTKVSPVQSIKNENFESTCPDSDLNVLRADDTDCNLNRNEIIQGIETFVNNYETSKNVKTITSKSMSTLPLTGNIESKNISASYINDLNSRRSDYCYKVFKLFQDEAYNCSERKMQESQSETGNKLAENKLCEEEKMFSNAASNEEKLPNLPETTDEHEFTMAANFSDKLKLESEEHADIPISESADVTYDDIPNFLEVPDHESTPRCEKSNYKVSTLFQRTAMEQNDRNQAAFFNEMSQESGSETDSEDEDESNLNTEQHSRSQDSESETESCTDSSDSSSLTSSSVEEDSFEKSSESYHDRESSDGSEEPSYSSSSVQKFVCDKKKMPVNFNRMHSVAQPSSRSERNQHHPHSSYVSSYQMLNHSNHSNASMQPDISSFLNTHQHANRSVHFPAYHHPHNSICSECKHVSRKKHSVRSKSSAQGENQRSCSSRPNQHSFACFRPSEHRCHPYNDRSPCQQQAICAQWYQIFYNQWLHIQRHSYLT